MFPKQLHYWELRPKHSAPMVQERVGSWGPQSCQVVGVGGLPLGSRWEVLRRVFRSGREVPPSWVTAWALPCHRSSLYFHPLPCEEMAGCFSQLHLFLIYFPGGVSLVPGLRKTQKIPARRQGPICQIWPLTDNSLSIWGNSAKHIYLPSLDIFSTKCAGIST